MVFRERVDYVQQPTQQILYPGYLTQRRVVIAVLCTSSRIKSTNLMICNVRSIFFGQASFLFCNRRQVLKVSLFSHFGNGLNQPAHF